jgi:Protein of unknown function (DUF3152)/Putative peptidoglycan binding domain
MQSRRYGRNPQGYHAANKPWYLTPRFLRDGVIGIILVFIVANIGLWAYYRNRTYPNTQIIQTSVGSVAFSQLAQKANELKLLPTNVMLQYGSQKATVSLADLGIRQDVGRSADSAKAQRSWLPIVNLFGTPHLQAPVATDNAVLSKEANTLANTFHKDPTNAQLALNGTTVSIAGEQDGYNLDTTKLGSVILSALDKGQTNVTVAVKKTVPENTTNSLTPVQQDLQKQINTQLTFSYGGKTKQTTSADVAKWYVKSGAIYKLSDVAVGNYLVSVGQSFGIHVKDISQIATDVENDIQSHKNTTIPLAQQIAEKTMHYCTSLKGLDASVMPTLQATLSRVYNDYRGWNLGGLIDFEPATSNCDFTVWLVASDQMTSFGAICDPVWNCEPGGDNVVLNYDRWTKATGPWLSVYPDGNLDEYRAMAINHETGHQLGFVHQICTPDMAGQPSPVMQQESIDLHGCTFNAWPLPSELAVLKERMNL